MAPLEDPADQAASVRTSRAPAMARASSMGTQNRGGHIVRLMVSAPHIPVLVRFAVVLLGRSCAGAPLPYTARAASNLCGFEPEPNSCTLASRARL